MHLQLANTACVHADHGRVLALSAHDAAMLAWLALEGPTTRARLATLLWPGSSAEAARNSLRQRLFQLRKLLGIDVVVGKQTLALADCVSHDLADADSVLGDEPATDDEFGQWLTQQRERRIARMRRALATLCDAAAQVGDYADAMVHAGELLGLDPLAEDVHRRLMRLRYLSGDRAGALQAFDHCEQLLKHELGTAPAAETLALLATIQASEAAVAPADAGELPAAVLRPPRMVGRAAELAALQCGVQQGAVQAVIGDAGMGKTRLLQEFARLQPAPQTLHVAARPGDMPLALLARLLRALASLVPVARLSAPTRCQIVRVLPELGQVEMVAPPSSAPGQRAQLLRALVDWLGQEAAPRAVLLDDLHVADAASLDILLALLDAGEETAAELGVGVPRWVLAWRPAESRAPLPDLQQALLERVRALHLQPLDPLALAELVDTLALPGLQGQGLAPALRMRTGGNPLFVLETLKQAWVERRLHELPNLLSWPRPASVQRLIERRLAQLSPSALTLARVACLAGVDFSLALAEHVLGAAALHFADAMRELEAAQVWRADAFAHDLVLEVVQAGIPAGVAAHSHGRIAQWLEGQQGEAARVAHHWLAAAEPRHALPWLRAAAAAAGNALRGAAQIDFLLAVARIEEGGGDPGAAFETVHAIIEARIDVDRGALGWSLCERLDELASTPRQALRALQQRAWFAFNRGELGVAIDAAARLLAQAQAQQETLLAADARSVSALSHSLLGDGELALHEMALAEPSILSHGSERARAELHGSYAVVLDEVGRHEQAQLRHRLAIAQAERCDYHAHAVIVRCNLALSLRRSGLMDQALEQLQQAERLRGLHERMEGPAVNLLPATAILLAELGRYVEALQWCDRAEAHLARHSPRWRGVASNHRLLCWVHLGQLARAQQELQRGDIGLDAAPAWLRASRCLLAARLARYAGHPTSGALAALEQGLSLLGQGARAASLRHALVLERCRLTPPEQAHGDALEVARQADALGHQGVLIAALARLAALEAALGLPRVAEHGPRALQLLQTYQVRDSYLAEVWRDLVLALRASGHAERAAALLAQARAWLLRVQSEHVPPEFRDGFARRNPVNAELLAPQR